MAGRAGYVITFDPLWIAKVYILTSNLGTGRLKSRLKRRLCWCRNFDDVGLGVVVYKNTR